MIADPPTQTRDFIVTDIPLRDYFEARLAALEHHIKVAAAAMEKRLDAMNEIREQLRDQAATFMPRSEYNIHHEKLVEDVRDLRESKAQLEGKASQKSVNVTLVISIFGLILALISVIERLLHP